MTRGACCGCAILLLWLTILPARAGSDPPQWTKSQAGRVAARYRAGTPLLRNVPDGEVVTTRTVRVEIYPAGALITRRAAVKLEPGEHRLVLPALPNTLDASTLHIAGFGRDAVAGSTFLEAGTLVEARPPELVELEEALHEVEAQDRTLAGQEEAFRRRRDLLLVNLGHPGEGSRSAGPIGGGPVATVEALGRLLDYGQTELLRIEAELTRLEAARQELTPQLQGIRTDYRALRSRLERPVKHVVVEVSVSARTEIPLVVRYFVQGPSWKPRHVCRYDPATDQITLETYAWIVQETGERWQDVQLVVSSARPSGGLHAPGPQAVELTLARAAGRIADEASGLGEVAAAATGLAGSSQREFVGPAAVTIESGGRGRRILLETLTTGAAARRLATPRVSPGVYLLLTLANPQITPLLPGEAALFNGADYVGTATIPALLPGETLALPYGRDPSVELVRNRAARDAEVTRTGQKVRYQLRYQARNQLDRPIVLEVRDQLPVARDPQIRVVLDPAGPTPQPGGRDFPAGTLIWKQELPARGQESWELRYTVSAPAQQKILGAD